MVSGTYVTALRRHRRGHAHRRRLTGTRGDATESPRPAGTGPRRCPHPRPRPAPAPAFGRARAAGRRRGRRSHGRAGVGRSGAGEIRGRLGGRDHRESTPVPGRPPRDVHGAAVSPRVVLVGPPGSGKTTVAELLAERLNLPARDTDADV